MEGIVHGSQASCGHLYLPHRARQFALHSGPPRRRRKDGEAAAGYHGEVALDSETSRVLRLTATADDIPKDSRIFQSSVEVDYDFVDVAGHSYLLPSRSNSHMEKSYRQITNVVNFVDYRKFEVDSSIDFGTPKQ